MMDNSQVPGIPTTTTYSENDSATLETTYSQHSTIEQLQVVQLTQKEAHTVTVETIADGTTLEDIIISKVNSAGDRDKEDPFYVMDLGRLLEVHDEWEAALPSVTPFYAVKCNSNPALLKTLAALGTGFDCASKNEIKAVLDLGVSPDRIIFAHPCKPASHVEFAAKKGVWLMTFDNELELYKVKNYFQTARLVLRIKADAKDTIVPSIGKKFGCTVQEGYNLLHTAKDLDLDVIGVCFHVGSGVLTPVAYQDALEMAADLFKYASETVGYNFTFLDIGGGFLGTKSPRDQELFKQISFVVKKGLDSNFSAYPNLEIIAEPGRFFASSTCAFAVCVVAKRVIEDATDSTSKSMMYYMSDGIHGSFMYSTFDPKCLVLALLKPRASSSKSYPSILWGPTLNPEDKICDTELPELDVGDWLYLSNFGAYTRALAAEFNGFLPAKCYCYITETNREKFKQTHQVNLVEKSDGNFELLITA